jgi:hypothetical protein
MYLRIQAAASRFEPMPLFGRSITVSVSVAEGRRVGGKPKQFHVGYLCCLSVPCTSLDAVVSESFWGEVKRRMAEFDVPAKKQEQFVAQIETLLEAVASAKRDPETLRAFQTNPNKVLSELRLQQAGNFRNDKLARQEIVDK